MTADWREALLAGAGQDGLPEDYRREGGVIGRAGFLGAADPGQWTDSELVGRSETPRTTSAAEAVIRKRQIEGAIDSSRIQRDRPVLDLGCADGTFAHFLLQLGFERLVSTDILPQGVTRLDRSLDDGARERVLLIVDDMFKLPFEESSFGTVVAWGILSLTGDFERALELAWSWVQPGGYLLHAEPLLEQALVYPLVRGDLGEFRRVLDEGSRAGMWQDRDDRYPLKSLAFYEGKLSELPGAAVEHSGGIQMLPSLIIGGLAQDTAIDEGELDELAELLATPELDRLRIWRQAFWLVRKA